MSCPFCMAAKELLEQKEINSIILDYDKDLGILEDYKNFHKQNTVPIILHNDLISGRVTKVGGYTELLERIGSV